MDRKIRATALALLLAASAGPVLACEYERGKTKFVEYANCRYGEDYIQVIDLPDSNSWEHCIYFVQPFQPSKLLAVTRDEGGREVLSVNDRSQIGNPCYMTKSECDKALRAWQGGTN